jgi:glutathione S-transferase
MLTQLPLTSLAAIVNVIEYWAFSMYVGYAREKFKFPAPQTVGNVEWEKTYRVQMNTLENLPILLTSLLVFASFSGSDQWAGILGLMFAFGRFIYAIGYYGNPKNRGFGFLIGLLALVPLMFGSLYFVLRTIL